VSLNARAIESVMRMRIMHVVGARPNFMKAAPLIRRMNLLPEVFSQTLVHTGQHYDERMSKVFFDELDLPRPDIDLSVGSGSHAAQTAQVMLKFEPVVVDRKPDWVVVPGDVNSTLACALVCSKLGIKVAHVEAGLRSFDRSMPEEINRVLTDQMADLLFVPSRDGQENLLREGVAPARIHMVGNIMIDTLLHLLPRADQRWPEVRTRLGLSRYILATLHRPSNVDEPSTLREILAALEMVGSGIPVLFPVHPRTRQSMLGNRLSADEMRVRLIEPVGYLDFLALQKNAALVLTDSGGVQEETTFLGVPCLTLRANTERPITISNGTNRLVRPEREAIRTAVAQALTERAGRFFTPPELWDGGTADRIARVMAQL
jgi:UDP-N-acetylglucosamine 2-epimerase (non-hydrolysing)